MTHETEPILVTAIRWLVTLVGLPMGLYGAFIVLEGVIILMGDGPAHRP